MIDIASDTWATVKKRCEERITMAAGVVMASGVDERTADESRGEIAAYRDILALTELRLVQQPVFDPTRRTDRSGI